MATKWAKLRERFNDDGTRKFKDAPAGDMDRALDPVYVDKIAQAKLPYLGMSLGDLMVAFRGFQEKKDELDEQWKANNLELEAIGQLLKDKFQAQNVNSVKTDFGQTLYLNTEPYAYVKKDQKQQFEERISADAELDYLWSINFMTMNSWIKGLIENVQEDQIPPEIEVWLKTQVRMRKS
jgi:hypothetical protein